MSSELGVNVVQEVAVGLVVLKIVMEPFHRERSKEEHPLKTGGPGVGKMKTMKGGEGLEPTVMKNGGHVVGVNGKMALTVSGKRCRGGELAGGSLSRPELPAHPGTKKMAAFGSLGMKIICQSGPQKMLMKKVVVLMHQGHFMALVGQMRKIQQLKVEVVVEESGRRLVLTKLPGPKLLWLINMSQVQERVKLNPRKRSRMV